MGGNSEISLREFEALVKSWDCSPVKTTKESEVRDNRDGMRISGFATVSGRQVKPIYVKKFLKAIKAKRGIDVQQEISELPEAQTSLEVDSTQ